MSLLTRQTLEVRGTWYEVLGVLDFWTGEVPCVSWCSSHPLSTRVSLGRGEDTGLSRGDREWTTRRGSRPVVGEKMAFPGVTSGKWDRFEVVPRLSERGLS